MMSYDDVKLWCNNKALEIFNGLDNSVLRKVNVKDHGIFKDNIDLSGSLRERSGCKADSTSSILLLLHLLLLLHHHLLFLFLLLLLLLLLVTALLDIEP